MTPRTGEDIKRCPVCYAPVGLCEDIDHRHPSWCGCSECAEIAAQRFEDMRDEQTDCNDQEVQSADPW